MSEPMSELSFDRQGMERADNLVMDYKYETQNGVPRRRLYVVDPDCAQDHGYCPCGPIGEWEDIPAAGLGGKP